MLVVPFLILLVVVIAVFLYLRRRQPKLVLAEPPFLCDFKKYELAVPLKKSFRFAHEPLGPNSNGRFVGRQAELEALALRILFSEGGSFLVTGYRGVGKTSFVNQVVKKLEEIVPWSEPIFGETRVISVQLNLARPLTPAELMHHIIRRLYEELREQKILASFDRSLRDELKLAYDRTSFNMTRTLGEETEAGAGVDQAGFGASWLASLKGSLSYRKKYSEGSEYEFVGYDDKAAEHDIVTVSRKLVTAFESRRRLTDYVTSFVAQKKHLRKTRLLIVFVFDELDKLEEFTITKKGGRVTTPIDELLGTLKNVFTTSGVSFVFVAGKDTQERWLEDLGKGDSVYESVFAYDKYLPCMWSDVNELCDAFVDWQALSSPAFKYCQACGAAGEPDAEVCSRCRHPYPPPTVIMGNRTQEAEKNPGCPQCLAVSTERMFCNSCGRYLRAAGIARSAFEDFKKYLDYRGRGIPRRIIRGFNEYVVWNGEQPILAFSKNDLRSIRVYAELRDLLALHESQLFGEMHEEVPGTIRDKRRLGVYYLIDWILRKGSAEFTIKDAVAASKLLSAKIAPAEEVALTVISDIIDVLVSGEFVTEIEERLDKVRIEDVSAKQEKRYQLVERRLIEMRGDGDVFAADAYAYREAIHDADRIGHYQLLEKIGTGGMGTVYRAWNEQNGQVVAVKILPREFSGDPQAVERFRRESQIMSQLRHPNIVTCYETAQDQGRLYIAMEFVEGIDLSKIISSGERLPLPAAVHIARAIADALQYVHQMGFVRNDIKPANVMLSKSGNIYLMDFGIAKKVEPQGSSVTLAGTIVGTPTYMSPEQVKGEDVDARSDIYSFGVLFYEMVTGALPFNGDSIPAMMYQRLHESPPSPSHLVPGLPPVIESIILKCLQTDPADRFQSSAELLTALKPVDEGMKYVNIGEFVGAVIAKKRNVEARAQQDTRELISFDAPAPPPGSTTEHHLKPGSGQIVAPPPPPVGASQTAASTASFRSVPPPPAGIGTSQAPASATSFGSVPPPPPPIRASTTDAGLAPPVVLNQTFETQHDTSKTIELVLTHEGEFDPPERRLTFPAGTPQIRIGRHQTNELSLNDAALSRFHAAIEFRDGHYYLRDLNTANGTALNGVRVSGAVEVHSQDVITVGRCLIRFTLK